MSERSFLDTNVLIYLDDLDSPLKRSRARKLIQEYGRLGEWVVSTQVLQEYFAAATRKLGVDAAIARRKVELFARFDLVQLGLPEILGAIDLHRLHSLPFWDALILRAAQISRCTILYSEDFQHGRVFDGGVQVRNPFLESSPA